MKVCLLLLIFQASIPCWSQGKKTQWVETFDNNDKQWPFIGEFGLSIANGFLEMDGNRSAIHTYKDAGLVAEQDFGIYSRMIFINGSHLEWMGVRFMMSPDAKSYASFVYNNDKGFLIAVTHGEKREVLRQSKSTVIKAYDYNTLTVIKTGNLYKFLINDKQVHEVKIKQFFGPNVALITNQNMKMQVDELQVYDLSKGRERTIASTIVVNAGNDIDKLVAGLDTKLPEDFQKFYDSFQKFVYPYDYSTVIERAHDVTNLPFVQRAFFSYELSQISKHTVWAVAHLANCQNGYAFLVVNQYTINNQENTRFSVEAFDKAGKSLGSKDVGSFVKESGGYFKTLDFKVSREGNSIFIQSTETFSNGNKQRNSVSFNTELCNL